jgi:hypothetical protein
MPMEEKKAKNDPMIDVGEEEGAEVTLDNNEQTKAVAEEKIEVQQEEEKPVVESKKEEKPVEEKTEVKTEQDDKLEKYSESVKKRIAKLTFEKREAERQREEAIRFAQTIKQEAESKYSKLDKTYISEFEKRVKTNLEAVRTALKNAIESGNIDAQIVAQEQLASLNIDAARLGALKAREQNNAVKQDARRDINITPQQTETPSVDPKAEDWASRNSWFGSDSAMTYTAFDLHKRLVNDEGYDPKSDEYYAEIDKRIRLEFPHKFGKVEDNSTERAKPAQTVASAKRPSQTGRKKTVKLTPTQVAIAKRLGVPLEEYAKQLIAKEV